MLVNSEMEYQKAIAYIFQLIKEGKLIIGSKIPSERDLAETLGIGRNFTREALSILRGMGIIESVHGSGNYITANGGAAIKQIVSAMLALGSISRTDIQRFRRALSASICRYISDNEFDAGKRARIEAILLEMDGATREDFARLDWEFHMTLIRATENPMFAVMVEPVAELYLELIRDVIVSCDEETVKKFLVIHQGIYDSIVNKDMQSCSEYIREHYELAEKQIKQHTL